MSKVCKKCGEAAKEYVELGGDVYHSTCFTCKGCNITLAGQPFIPHGDDFYCEKHHPDMKTCGHCDEGLTGEFIEALGKAWHNHHFLCSDCGADFPDDKFHKIEDNPYCSPCYTKRVADECSFCKEPITTEVCFELDGKKIHQKCYVCPGGSDGASHELTDQDQVVPYQGKIMCLKHIEQVVPREVCSSCKQPIEGTYLKVESDKYHPQCFKCCECGDKLDATTKALKSEKGVICSKHSGGASAGSAGFAAPSATEASVSPTGSSGPVIGGAPPGSPAAAAGVAAGTTGGAVDGAPIMLCSLEVLRGPKTSMPPGIDFAKREIYLDDAVFQDLFGMDKPAFAKLPSWRKKQKKQQVGLF